jgi:hypothetical protein
MAKAKNDNPPPVPPPPATLTFGDDNPSPEVLYIRAFRATAKICAQAMAMFKVLAEDATTAAARADARARRMQAEQELELVRALHDTVVDGDMTIHPPTAQQVAATLQLADDLAKISAEVKNFSAIVQIFEDVGTAFNAIHGKPLPAKPAVAAGKAPG